MINGREVSIPVVRLEFKRWQGPPITDTFGGKRLIDFDNGPVFAELAIVRLANSVGWNARWVETYAMKNKSPYCKERSITINMITEQILAMVDNGCFDDTEPTEQLFNKIEQYKRVTSQLIKGYGIERSEKTHFRNYASYVLKQGTLNEQDGFIRGLNLTLFVKDKQIYRRYKQSLN